MRVLAARAPTSPRRASSRSSDPGAERTLFVIGENDHPTADDPLPWDELAGMDGVYFTGQDPRTLELARSAPMVVVTARRFESLRRSGIRADALVGSGSDRGEQFDLARLAVQPDHVIVTNGAARRHRLCPGRRRPGRSSTPMERATHSSPESCSGWHRAGRWPTHLAFAAARAAEALTWRGSFPRGADG